MKMKRIVLTLVSASLSLGGCATASKDVAASYVSPLQYQSFDCSQISSESQRVLSRVSQVGGRLDEAASNDKSIGVVGGLFFWPALFFLGGTKAQEAEYGRLKGEYDGLQQAAIAKKCTGIVIASNPAAETSVSPAKAESAGSVAPTQPRSVEEKLIELKRLHDAGLITPEVYSAQQKVILGG